MMKALAGLAFLLALGAAGIVFGWCIGQIRRFAGMRLPPSQGGR